MEERSASPKDTRSVRPKPITADWLFRAGAHYLERYASSAEGLRRILRRKVEKRLATHEDAPDEEGRAGYAALVDEAVARFVELKLVDDRTFAEAKLRSLRRVGTSSRQAAAKLGQKGVGRETIATAIGEDETSDREAAHRYAKRRRFGPHRMQGRDDRRDRDIAAMMRAGFSLADARAAVDGDEDDVP